MHAAYVTYERSLREDPSDFYDGIIAAAWEGCDSTKNMEAK